MKYWENRINHQNELIYNKTQKEIDNKLKHLYIGALKDVQRDMLGLYLELLEDNEDITINSLYRYNRYFALRKRINDRLTTLGNNEIELLDDKFINMYEYVQQGTKDIISPMVEFNEIGGDVRAVVDSVWCADGKHWSKRVWDNKAKLQLTLEKGLVDCVSNGATKDKLVGNLIKRFDVGYSTADRLARTELTYVQNQATKDTYKQAGVTQYRYLSALDSRTSKVCSNLTQKVYDLNMAQAGVNYPPMHPNCRCTTIPIIE